MLKFSVVGGISVIFFLSPLVEMFFVTLVVQKESQVTRFMLQLSVFILSFMCDRQPRAYSGSELKRMILYCYLFLLSSLIKAKSDL